MLRRTFVCFPLKHYDEVNTFHRRIGPYPVKDPREGVYPVWQEKMTEFGDEYNRVFCTLGDTMNKRNVFRNKDKLESSFYWRPIAPKKQRRYQMRLRWGNGWYDKSNGVQKLVPTNSTENKQWCYTENDRLGMRSEKYGKHLAPPRPKDFEFRVY